MRVVALLNHYWVAWRYRCDEEQDRNNSGIAPLVSLLAIVTNSCGDTQGRQLYIGAGYGGLILTTVSGYPSS